jgi:hypothetical protein
MWKKIEADMAQSIRAEVTSPSNVGHAIDSVKIVRPGQVKALLMKKANQLRQTITATLRLLLLVLLNKAGKEKERKRRLIVLLVMLRKRMKAMRKRGRLGNKYLS